MEQSISSLISEIRAGNIAPSDILHRLSARIRKTDGKVKSYVSLNDSAHGEAAMLDKMAASGEFLGPLHGIPVSVKDLIDTKDIRTTYGSPIFKENVPLKDSKVVDLLKHAGSYVLGKTNTHEFALGIETSPTVNPHDFQRIPGGSSGGSAASLAAGSSIFALGTDTGGSIRIPAAMCGITGFKPTYGSLPVDGIFPESWSLDHVGPMARFAEDIPLLMGAMGSPVRIEELSGPLRAGIIGRYFDQSSEPVSKAVHTAIKKLESERVIEILDFNADLLESTVKLHEIIDTAEIAAVHRDLYSNHPGKYLETSIEQIKSGFSRSAVEYAIALENREKIYEEVRKELAGLDLLISPTLPEVAPTIKEISEMGISDHGKYVRFQSEFNYLGMPALSVPCGFTGNLPVGMQIISDRFKDGVAVSVGIEYQKITDWHLRRADC